MAKWPIKNKRSRHACQSSCWKNNNNNNKTRTYAQKYFPLSVFYATTTTIWNACLLTKGFRSGNPVDRLRTHAHTLSYFTNRCKKKPNAWALFFCPSVLVWVYVCSCVCLWLYVCVNNNIYDDSARRLSRLPTSTREAATRQSRLIRIPYIHLAITAKEQ